MNRNSMNSWLDLEKRFREISAKLSFTRIDHQWGAAGEYWRITGSATTPTVQEFELLTALAGTALKKAIKKSTPSAEFVFSEADDKTRWFRALRAWSGGFESADYACQTDENGKFAGNIFTDTMHDPALMSANLCLRLHTDYPFPEKSFWRKARDEYGSKIIVGTVVTGITALGGLLFNLLFG